MSVISDLLGVSVCGAQIRTAGRIWVARARERRFVRGPAARLHAEQNLSPVARGHGPVVGVLVGVVPPPPYCWNWPTTIVTVEPSAALPLGLWLTTMPFFDWSVTFLVVWLTVKPAACRALVACPRVSPVTLGMGTLAGVGVVFAGGGPWSLPGTDYEVVSAGGAWPHPLSHRRTLAG
jgi:hypothetical protein